MKAKAFAKYGLTILVVFILIVILINVMIFWGQHNIDFEQSEAVSGTMTLDSRSLENGNLVLLNGEWEFYPGKYLKPQDFLKNPPETRKKYAEVPGVQADDEDSEAANTGTYRLRLKAVPMEEKLAFRVVDNQFPFKLFVNGRLVAEAGQVGKDAESTVYSAQNVTVSFDPSKDTEIVLQTCNFTSNSVAISYPVIVGKETVINHIVHANQQRDWFMLGALCMMAIYYFLIFYVNREYDKSAFTCIGFAVLAIFYTLGTNEHIIYDIFPRVQYETINNLSFALPMAGGTLLILFLHLFYEDLLWKPMKYITVIKAVIFETINLFAVIPFLFINHFFIDACLTIEFAYVIMVLAKAINKKRPYAVVIMISTLILLSSIAYTVTYYVNVTAAPYGGMVSAGSIIFILGFALVVAADFYKSYQSVIQLSGRLTEANQLKDEFLTNTSHELRTPINSMVALTESVLLGDQGQLDREQKETLTLVAANGKRLANLINDILDYSRLKHGDLKLIKKAFSMEKLLGKLEKEFSLMAARKNIDFSIETDPLLPQVYADEYRIIQVIYNLYGNAVKFTKNGGKIRISARMEKDAVFVSVRDTGIGISEDKLEDIFKSFEQESASIAETFGGLGLGLSISKQIVESHGMEIRVESQLGKGTVFTFGIPIYNKQENPEKGPVEKFELIPEGITITGEERLESSGTRPGTIIVIDDNYSNVLGILGILKTEGYSIKGFTKAAEGLEEAFRNPQAVLMVVDLMMPEISGYEVCRRIRERFSLLDLPILILTAKVQVQSITESLKCGANDYLNKPFDAEELKARVNTLCSLKDTSERAIANELAFLQAQIKPHFLYNVLNTISAFCIDEGERAGELIDNLSTFLRNSFIITINDENKMISLSKELELVRAYVEIEKARFDDKITVEYEIEEEINCFLPPLIIQPLIENAIRHGLVKKEEMGRVLLAIHKKDEEIHFIVTDDGVGMPEEKCEKILSEKEEHQGVGLININRRLIRFYGQGLTIESKIGKGTKVSFRVYDYKKEDGSHA